MPRPGDPRCPECGGPISATAVYCLHCKADLGDGLDDSADVTDADDLSWDVSTGSPDDEGMLAPDGLLDHSLTVAVGVVAGAIAGVLALVVLVMALLHWVGVLLAFVVWIGTTVYVARRRTVYGALRVGAYAVALMLVLVPMVSFSPALEGGTSGGRVVLFVFLGVVLGVPAAVLWLFGYAMGRRRPDEPA